MIIQYFPCTIGNFLRFSTAFFRRRLFTYNSVLRWLGNTVPHLFLDAITECHYPGKITRKCIFRYSKISCGYTEIDHKNEICRTHKATARDNILVYAALYPQNASLIARFMGPTWGPSGADRTQVGPMLAPWTSLSGLSTWRNLDIICPVLAASCCLKNVKRRLHALGFYNCI